MFMAVNVAIFQLIDMFNRPLQSPCSRRSEYDMPE